MFLKIIFIRNVNVTCFSMNHILENEFYQNTLHASEVFGGKMEDTAGE